MKESVVEYEEKKRAMIYDINVNFTNEKKMFILGNEINIYNNLLFNMSSAVYGTIKRCYKWSNSRTIFFHWCWTLSHAFSLISLCYLLLPALHHHLGLRPEY